MVEFKPGQTIPMEYGGELKVISTLGRGGQGIVYLVEYNNLKYALKWYDMDKMRDPQAFRKNLEVNIKDGPPSDKFLWPKYLTKMGVNDSFGYLMTLRPPEYDSFVDILNMYKLEVDPATGKAHRVTVQFKNLNALVTAAINIVNAFRQLHRAGKSYQDLNDGGFFINVSNGDVLVCDCDNIAPDGYNFGIGGKPGYMAPEIVRGVCRPDVQTDKYSLAVVLFKLLFRGDPLEGEKVVKTVCLTETAELKHYGKEAVFVFDPNNDTNRPVKGIHDNVIKFWGIYPNYIRQAFTFTFTTGISQANKRIIENEWQKLFIRLRSEILPCYCGRTTFSSAYDEGENNTLICRRCGRKYATLKFSNRDYRTPIFVGRKIYMCEAVPGSDDFSTVVGEIVENKIQKGVLGIKNMSDKIWHVRMPDGSSHEVAPGKGFPLWSGVSADMGGVKIEL